VERIGIHGISKVVDDVEEGHVKPPVLAMTTDVGKTWVGNSRVIRILFQAGEGHSSYEGS